MDTRTQTSSLPSELSRNPVAVYQREYYLKNPQKLDDHGERQRKYRSRKKLAEITRERSSRNHSAPMKVGFLKSVEHHLARGRDAGMIAVWTNRQVSEVEAAIKQLKQA